MELPRRRKTSPAPKAGKAPKPQPPDPVPTPLDPELKVVVAEEELDPFEKMNSLERRYAEHLVSLEATGEIRRWDFQPVKLRLADRTFYTPDFRVIANDRTEQYHETKGFWRDDARAKIKMANEQHPYVFVAVQWKAKQWVFEVI